MQGTLTVGALFVLRYRHPTLPRPYKATAYPLLPGIYIVSSLFVIVVMTNQAASLEAGSWYPLLGLNILLITYVFHRLYHRSAATA